VVASQPTTQLFQRIFGECNLQAAIDFAVLRSEAELEAWLALRLSLTFSRLAVF